MYPFIFFGWPAGITLAIVVLFYIVSTFVDIFHGRAKPLSVAIVLSVCLWVVFSSFSEASSGDKVLIVGCFISMAVLLIFDTIHLNRLKAISEAIHQQDDIKPVKINKSRYSSSFMAFALAISFIVWIIVEKARTVNTGALVIALALSVSIALACLLNGIHEFKKERFRYLKHVKNTAHSK